MRNDRKFRNCSALYVTCLKTDYVIQLESSFPPPPPSLPFQMMNNEWPPKFSVTADCFKRIVVELQDAKNKW